MAFIPVDYPEYTVVISLLMAIMNHDSGFIIGIAYDFCKTIIERTPKTYLEKQPST